MDLTEFLLHDVQAEQILSNKISKEMGYDIFKPLLHEIIKECTITKIDEYELNNVSSDEYNEYDEYLIYYVFEAMINIHWFQSLESLNTQKGYEKTKGKLEKARILLQHYSVDEIKYILPRHQNNIIKELKKNIKHKKIDIAIELLKKYFNIERATATSELSSSKTLSEIIENFQKSFIKTLKKIK